MIELLPITQREARAWVNQVHRHLDYPRGDVYRTSLSVHGSVAAVGVAGRPSARMLQDGRTLEITRVASGAEPSVNACSRLYGTLMQAGRSIGYRRFVTYTLPGESGASCKAAGFVDCGLTDGGEWDRRGRQRKPAECAEQKRRWMWPCPKCGKAGNVCQCKERKAYSEEWE